MRKLLSIWIIFGLMPAVTALAGTVAYEAVVLHPSGFLYSRAYGVWSGQQVGEGRESVDSYNGALLWSGSAESLEYLWTFKYFHHVANAVSDGQQVGWGAFGVEWEIGFPRAILWSGPDQSGVDLHPWHLCFIESEALGVSGGQQVGWGGFSGDEGYYQIHALLWSGTAESVVDLNPPGYEDSIAYDVSDDQQVGEAVWSQSGRIRAVLWSGTAESVVDLHPSGFSSSRARGIWGDHQVGYAHTGIAGNFHALLWSGTAESAVDLHPVGFDRSRANAICGGYQVGYGYGEATGGYEHALLWSGTAGSALDLHDLLSEGYERSYANDIDSTGDIVDYATTSEGRDHAVLWRVLLPGDVDGDRVVRADDLVAILSSWGQTGATRQQGDLTGDGFVGADDYVEV